MVTDREFEAWFLATIDAFRGHPLVRAGARVPARPEAIRGAKEALSRFMTAPYRPALHQGCLAAAMDIDLAPERCRSFRKLYEEASRILVAS